MPRLRPHPFLAIPLLVAALALFSASTLLAQPLSDRKAKPAKTKTMTWDLTQAAVIDPGKTEGKFTTGYVVQATATAKGPARVNTGKFTMTCTIEDKGDHFELRGAWDITKAGAVKTASRNPDSIKGLSWRILVSTPPSPTPRPGSGRSKHTPWLVLSGVMAAKKTRPLDNSRVMRTLMGSSPSPENEARPDRLKPVFERTAGQIFEDIFIIIENTEEGIMRARKRLFAKVHSRGADAVGERRGGRRSTMGLCAGGRAELPIQGPGGGGLRAASLIFHRKSGAD